MTRSLILKRNVANLVEDFLSKLARATDTPVSKMLVHNSLNSGQGEVMDPLIRCLTGSLVNQSALDTPAEIAIKLANTLTRFSFVTKTEVSSDEQGRYWLHTGEDNWVLINMEGHNLTELFTKYDVVRTDRFVIPCEWKTTHGTFD